MTRPVRKSPFLFGVFCWFAVPPVRPDSGLGHLITTRIATPVHVAMWLRYFNPRLRWESISHCSHYHPMRTHAGAWVRGNISIRLRGSGQVENPLFYPIVRCYGLDYNSCKWIGDARSASTLGISQGFSLFRASILIPSAVFLRFYYA